MEHSGLASHSLAGPQLLPNFAGTPYIATQLDVAFYHLILLPLEWQEESFDLAVRQAAANQLPTFLVLDRRAGFAFSGLGEYGFVSIFPVHGMTLVQDRLYPALEIPPSEELETRREALESYAKQTRGGRYILGDLSKGGRMPTEAELGSLSGSEETGAPKGLELCEHCWDWRGICLDCNPHLPQMVVRVSCLCDNVNRCARCGELLHERRLRGNEFNAMTHEIWYTPGFSGLSHRCAG